MPAAKKLVSDVLIIHLSIILSRVNGRAGHCQNNDRRLSHVQANEEISTLLYALGHYFSDEGLTRHYPIYNLLHFLI